MKKTILTFSLLVVALLLLFQVSKYSVFFGKVSVEIVTTIVAIVFLVLGIYLNKGSLRKLTNMTSEIDKKKIKELEISSREYEVLQKISEGLSNKEIAEQLFVSESTIKTHVSNLLVKLNAKRRTQAIQIAQELNIL